MTAGSASRVVYETTVSVVGEQVAAFLDHGLLIFFGDQAPPELHDISVLHRPVVTEDAMQAGDVLQLGSTELEVLAAGGVVRDNLLNLGHFDLKADGRSEPKLPGDVCVASVPLPLLAPGDRVRVLRPSHDIEETERDR